MAAKDAGESLDRIHSLGCLPDVIVSDHRLAAGHTGVEAIRMLREELGEEVPAIILTGDSSGERIREAKEAQLPLLHKPIDVPKLEGVIRQVTRKK